MIGQTISHYRILEKLGEGGMGEVYLAQDTGPLDRKVALKFPSQEMQQDPIAQQRFLREARSAAALAHPYVCHIHEVGEDGEQSFISMEYVAGQSLKDRLAKGPLELRDSLQKATEIAEALEAAHKQNIVHRDLKPANIMLTPEGHVKVMDFGLAKRLTAAQDGGSQEKTLTTSPTRTGATLGTLAYMSPEQLRGGEVDTRSDIFSFGIVLYEMLTRVHPFKKSQSMETGNAILNEAPASLSRHVKEVPPVLQHTVRKMLAKEPRRRYQHIDDVRVNLEELTGDRLGMEEYLAEPSAYEVDVTARPQPDRWKRAIPWTFAAVMVVIVALMLWNQPPIIRDTQPLTRTEITLPSTSPLGFGSTYAFDPTLIALSPDARKLAFVGRTARGTQLYLRSMDSLEIAPIVGTEGAIHPFFSPDSNWVGFLTLDRVKKISLHGGGPITLCEAQTPIRATWAGDGMIYFGAVEGRVLMSVPAGGGEARTIGRIQDHFDQILPDGHWALVTVRSSTSIREDFSSVYALSLQTLERKLLIEGGYDARYVPSGHLLFARTGVLMAVPFDLEHLEVLGEPQPVLHGMTVDSLFAQVQVSFSDTGTVVYCPGGDVSVGRIARVGRDGKTELLPVPERVYGVVELSPNNQRLAVQVADVKDYVWIYDLQRGEGHRLVGTGQRGWPKWNPSEDSITFIVREGEKRSIVERRLGAQEERELIALDSGQLRLGDWSPDGSTLVFNDIIRKGLGFLFVGQQPNIKWLEPPPGVRYWHPTFSPDGRWVAYFSDETGQQEIWIRSFPDGEQVYQVSTEGAMEPVWAPSGELFYHVGHRWMVVRISTHPRLQWDPPELAFETDYVDTPGVSYDVSSDGRYLYVVKGTHPPDPTRLHVVQNWFEELKRLVPTGK